MYCKCGSIKDARQFFNEMREHNVISHTAMISGFSQHGLVLIALHLFEEMKESGVKPDGITFVEVLSACSHFGLVKEGWEYFESITDYGLEKTMSHYACMVDLLGRVGLVEKAEDLINNAPFPLKTSLWRTLLGACNKHGDVKNVDSMIKIVDLPLALWTPSGISRIASYIGIPLTVDPLTAMRTRLTFARVCAQISKDFPLPDEIPIQIDGEELVFNVIYDWKSSKCEGCGSLIHPYSLCASNPNPKPIMPPPVVKHRGRSGSRNPRSRAPGSSSKPPSPSSRIPDPVLPNLNFPTEESSSSEQPSLQIPKPPPKVPLKNMFASLQTEELASHHLDESSIGGNPIDINHIDDNPKDINHMIIHGILSAGSSSPIFLYVIYAAHNAGERKILWDHLRDLVPSHDQPYIILGGFSCLSFDSEKPNSEASSDRNSEAWCDLLDLKWFNNIEMEPIQKDCGHAYHLIDEMPDPKLVSWTRTISSYIKSGHAELGLREFRRMCDSGLRPNEYGLSLALKASRLAGEPAIGKLLHGLAIKAGFEANSFCGTSILDMYCKYGYMKEAQLFFDKAAVKCQAMWNSFIDGYSRYSKAQEAVKLFHQMLLSCTSPNCFTYTILIKHGAGNVDISFVKFIHAQGLRPNFKRLPLPDEIPIQIDGEELVFNVIYNWKPSKCEGCGSLIHPYSLCASNPNPKPIMPPPVAKHRGRSSSQNPRSRAPSSSSKPPSPSSRIPGTSHSPIIIQSSSTPIIETSSPTLPPLSNPDEDPVLPNQPTSRHLNESSIGGNPTDINHIDDNPEDINHMFVVFDPWFINSHLIFDNESGYNNFGFSNPGRIWLKWDSSHYSFSLTFSSSQIIHGILSAGSALLFFFLSSMLPTMQVGDAPLSTGGLGELNNVLFDCGVQELALVDQPIHIKLDRTLVNFALLDIFPMAYYKVVSLSSSDHSPVMFMASRIKTNFTRFMFKNYWVYMNGFWDEVLDNDEKVLHLAILFRDSPVATMEFYRMAMYAKLLELCDGPRAFHLHSVLACGNLSFLQICSCCFSDEIENHITL
ncbi:hypothetical protein M5K25_024510 [Dendrobium thyrsiflorum]|uniref:Pentatricopeptide repeat-containing protein n=1 Tax=Dendrobium thyrsiflorum TaxID=117978 RepID=A0ABD0U236_DENTH